MATPIKIIVGGLTVEAELTDTPCATAVLDALPLTASPQEWGDEFYFSTPVDEELDETARTVMAVGDIGYWPPGRALAIFFGQTPASNGEEPVAASEVNLVGRITGDATLLKEARGASSITVKRR